MNVSNDHILSLVNGCRQNNRESQRALYNLLYDYTYCITHRYSNDEEEANTLVNDSFLKLFKHIGTCKLDNSTNVAISLKAWFKKIIVNSCIDRYRSNKNKQSFVEPVPVADSSENGEDKLSYKEIMHSVRQLSAAYRTVFNLHVVEGFSHEEIGKMLSISVGTSKSNLSKAKEHLRVILQQKMNYIIPYGTSTRQ